MDESQTPLPMREAAAAAAPAPQFSVVLHPEAGNIRTFHSIRELQTFVDAEYAFWTKYNITKATMRQKFKTFRNAIAEAGVDNEQAPTKIAAVVATTNADTDLIYSETALGTFLAALYDQDADRAAGAYGYLRMNAFDASAFVGGRKAYVTGMLLAHTSAFSDADSKSRVAAEADRLQALRASVEELKNNADREFHSLQDSGKVWLDDVERALGKAHLDFDAWRKTTSEGTKASIDTQQSNFKNEIERLTKEHGDLVAEHNKILDSVQKAFREQARLQLPAEYWQRMETEYKTESVKWLKAAVVAGSVLALFGFVLLLNPIPSLLDAGISLSNIRGALLTLVILSTGAYFVGLFVRLATSAQHLARDAKERLQLTHVYLALIKEGAIDPKERDIILQAIFSRADTGLLKGDSSPTMPGQIGNLFDGLRPGGKSS